MLTRQRHQQILAEVQATLTRAIDAETRGLELAAEDLRLAARALGRLTGAVDVEALLDIVFADFCIAYYTYMGLDFRIFINFNIFTYY